MKDSENNYIKTNKIPGYQELLDSMENVAQEATLVNGIEEILSTTAKQGEDTGATLTDVQTSVEGIDETLTVALDEFLGDVSGYASNKEIYDELTDENYGLEAIKDAVDNIELDTSDLAKQGPDTTVTLTSVDEKIDGFYNTFDADIASQLQEIIGDSTTGLTGTTQTEEQVSTLRTLQESYDRLAGNMQSLADSWKEVVGDRKSIDGFTFENMSPDWAGDLFFNITKITHIHDTTTTQITSQLALYNVRSLILDAPVSIGGIPRLIIDNNTIQYFKATNLEVLDTTFQQFYGCGNLEAIELPKLKQLKLMWGIGNCSSLKEIHMPSTNSVSRNNNTFGSNCPNLILIELGAIATSFSLQAWSPTNALDASSQTLLTPEDIAAGFTSNLQKLLYNIREHIAANLPVAPNTITFSAAVKAAIQADQATADAFANKNWVIA